MASDDLQTNLRLPADLKQRLVASAAENNRSLSAEATSRLEESYAGQKDVVTKEVLKEFFAKLAREQQAERLAQVSIRDLLATCLMDMYKALPKRLQDMERFKFPVELAAQLKTEGNPDLEDVLARLLATDEMEPIRAAAAVIRRDTAAKRHLGRPRE